IEDLGIETFITTCRTFALDLLNKMTDQFRALGVWMDWDRPYMTIRNEFIEGAWWTLGTAHERGWIYEALRSTQCCSRDETALGGATAHECGASTPGETVLGHAYPAPLALKVQYQATVTGEWDHRVVASKAVEAEHAGLVHTAPGHGPEDLDVGQSLGLPVIS